MARGIQLDGDEIEVACDLLWFAKARVGLAGVAETLWQRLQPIRHGDYGGTASTEISAAEARAVIDAGSIGPSMKGSDEDEGRLLARLRSLTP